VNAPTYDLRPSGCPPDRYLRSVARLADEVLAAGAELHPIVDAYGAYVEETGRERRRSEAEYLLDALTLGVLWRARGADATRRGGAGPDLVDELAARRRASGARLRDPSTCLILSIDAPFEPGGPSPALRDLDRLLTWLVASGEYDDEVARLEGWEEFLRADPLSAEDTLAEIVAFAVAFEAWGEHALGIFTSGVRRFFRDDLPRRRWREDTIQCARRRAEYHLNMVGAEILNRAWRDAFLGCERHVLVMPGCMRSRADAECAAVRTAEDLRCTGCTKGCAVLTATRAAERAGAEAVAVVHGSDFSRFLRSPALRCGKTGVVGVACAPGLLGAGWRAKAAGFPAQCVLLESSGCEHWRDAARPTTMDVRELERILGTPLRARPAAAVPARIATARAA
jgi:hypothetical protein